MKNVISCAFNMDTASVEDEYPGASSTPLALLSE